MRKIFFIVMTALFLSISVTAQTKVKPKFTSLNQVGVVWGSTGDDLQLQTINGVNFKRFSAGLGVGLDYYWERTVPLFLDIRKNIFPGKQTPFVYADFGLSLPWVKKDGENTWQKTQYGDGIYYDFGIGYKACVHKNTSLHVSFGYSGKTLVEKRYDHIIDDFPPYDQNGVEKYNYILRRLSLKTGFSF